MIYIDLETIEEYDGEQNKFVYYEGGTVRFEYSLKVIYDWEAKWLKSWLKGDVNDEEVRDLYMMMALDPINEIHMTEDVMSILAKYITHPQTATTFTSLQNDQNGNKQASNGKKQTAEEIYALMFRAGIPIEFENRNLNRLITILRISASFDKEPQKMSKADIYKQNASLNEQRKAQLKTKG